MPSERDICSQRPLFLLKKYHACNPDQSTEIRWGPCEVCGQIIIVSRPSVAGKHMKTHVLDESIKRGCLQCCGYRLTNKNYPGHLSRNFPNCPRTPEKVLSVPQTERWRTSIHRRLQPAASETSFSARNLPPGSRSESGLSMVSALLDPMKYWCD